jgi:hypothetical protein
MSEKPGKRLVSKGQYLRLLGKRTALSSSAIGIACAGGILFLIVGVGLIRFGVFHQTLRQSMLSFFSILSVCCVAGIMAIRIAGNLFREAKAIERVAPITRHNTGDLPAVETLVRPSDLPHSHQQAQLLRAAPHGNETPVEELLRATENRQGD